MSAGQGRSGSFWLVMVVVVAGVFLWRSREPGVRDPEPVRFATVPLAAFDQGGTLTDAWADVDGDGDPDRFVGFNGAPSRLYRNDGAGGFTDVAAATGLVVERRVRTSAWGDYDGDGDPDLLLGYAGDGPVLALWRNDAAARGDDGRGASGAGSPAAGAADASDTDPSFTEVATGVGLVLDAGATRQASWVDVDGDGDLDLFVALRDAPNRLWRNDGATFTDVTAESGVGDPRRSVGAVWFDADTDGDLDVYVANMDGDANGMWLNDGGAFTDAAEAWGLADGGRALGDEAQGTVRPCVADYDGDGDLDLFTANYGRNGLFRNPGGAGAWTNVAAQEGLDTDSHFDTCAWADFDHDGRLDLYVNGTVTGGESYRDWLFRREGGPFVDVTPDALRVEADHGATWVDFDGDGDLDLALTGAQETGMHHLVQNLLRPEFARYALEVRVVGPGGASIPGAEVRVYAAGTDRLLGMRLVDTGSGYDAQNDLPVHVGLVTSQPLDVEVTVVAGGRRVTRVEGVDPDAHRGTALVVVGPA